MKKPEYQKEEFKETWDLLGEIESPELEQSLDVKFPSHGNIYKISYGLAVAASITIGVLIGSSNFNSISQPGVEDLMTESSFSGEAWSIDDIVVSLLTKEVN